MTQEENKPKRRRRLTATEKLLKIQELKAEGKTQVEVATELDISRRTVCIYWNNTNTMSRQESKTQRVTDHQLRLISIKQCKLEGMTNTETAKELGCSLRLVDEYWEDIDSYTESELLDNASLIKNKNYPPKIKSCETITDYNRLKLYNVSPALYDALFESQEGMCNICGTHQKDLRRALCLDHDHKTLKIRGLLCDRCNLFLGSVKDDVQYLERAIAHLKSYPAELISQCAGVDLV